MARPPSKHPTDGELEILRVLWADGSLNLSSLCQKLRAERDVATTTVATMLKVMREKKLVKRTGEGRGALWSAAVSHDRTASKLVGKLIDGVFEGSAQRLMAHLVENANLSDDDLAALQKLARQRRTAGNQQEGQR